LFLQTKDFITFNKDGINVVGLDSIHRRAIKDSDGTDKIIHSLESMNYLKIDHDNHLNYSCQKHSKREIQIEQEFYHGDLGNLDNHTHFQNLYNIKICQPTLRELLVYKSVYYA